MTPAWDVIVVGGGAAGLSAALVLAHCRRTVLVIDAGHPRNERASHLRNYLTRDGSPPADLLSIGRDEIERAGASFRSARVRAACCLDKEGPFQITLDDGREEIARRILLATGVKDELPSVENAERYYGAGLHHCPYCDGDSYSDRPLAAIGTAPKSSGLALLLRNWSADVTVLTSGPARFTRARREELAASGVRVCHERVARFLGDGRRLTGVELETGEVLPMAAVFFSTRQGQRSELPIALGCSLDKKGGIAVDNRGRAKGAGGVYIAGDALKEVQFLVSAAADGASAAVAIHGDLQEDDIAARVAAMRRGETAPA